MEQKHHAVAYFKLSYLVVLEDILELVTLEGPHSVGILNGVLGDNFGVYLVEFDKVRPPQAEILE